MSNKNIKNALQYGVIPTLSTIVAHPRPVTPIRDPNTGGTSISKDQVLGISETILTTLRDASSAIPVPAVGIAATLALGLLQRYMVSDPFLHPTDIGRRLTTFDR